MIKQDPAHCPAGALDLLHFVVKIVVVNVESERISMLVAFSCSITFNVLFLLNPQNISNLDLN